MKPNDRLCAMAMLELICEKLGITNKEVIDRTKLIVFNINQRR
mgnify:CR=1 FL=1